MVYILWSTVLGGVFHADDNALLSASCYKLQRFINICEQYGTAWDIRFNPTKSQLITFGGPNPSVCGIHINDKPIHWVNKIKYLGVYLLCNTGLTDITDSVRKFYGKFNNIMAVLSKHCAGRRHTAKIYSREETNWI